jgi:NAD(P)-dependent dehydrogenase (short-subunit alcohol dehydrogenase family)
MKTVVITGISGTLGSALGRTFIARGDRVVGVTRRAGLQGDQFSELVTSPQQSVEDARGLLRRRPDLLILNAGQIETEVGAGGLPLVDSFYSLNTVNYLFPCLVALTAAYEVHDHDLQVVAVGSIADGSPSPFGPVYHSSKIALHYFFSSVAPIVAHLNPRVRLRLFRPGVIKGPLSWAPVNRLNQRGYRIRARRCERAPEGSVVAERLIRWIERGGSVGTSDEPLGFKLLKYAFALSPGLYCRLQAWAWRRGSQFTTADRSSQAGSVVPDR